MRPGDEHLKHDILTYDTRVGELRINAATIAERELYRRLFGKHLFGDEQFFPGDEKYSLEPLLVDGKGSLDVTGVDGIEWVRLCKIEVFHGGSVNLVTCHSADDVFTALAQCGHLLHMDLRLRMASFQVKLAGVARPRSVTIRPSNLALYTRNDNSSVIERWLEK